MKINRWIKVPLYGAFFFAFWMFLYGLLLDLPVSFNLVLYWFLTGALIGFIGLYLSDRKARKISRDQDERAFEVRQKRTLVLLLEENKAFDLCREAILSLGKSKIRSEDAQNGTISAKVKMNWDSWGETIEIKTTKLNEKLTEVEIEVQPVVRVTMGNSGRSWKIAEDIMNFLKAKDAEINKKVLVESAEILEEVYVKSFQKEQIENIKQ